MSDVFYKLVRVLGRHAFWLTANSVILHVERTRRAGPFILASNHLSPFDVPLLIRHTRCLLEFVSIVEVFRKPFLGWFYGSMNAFPHDRSKPDSPTVRIILDRLARGRVVAMFPEGGVRELDRSVVTGGRMRPGIGRLAMLANVPILPAVVVQSGLYSRWINWIPLRRVRYGVIYGLPLEPRSDLDKSAAATDLEERLRAAFIELYREITEAMATK